MGSGEEGPDADVTSTAGVVAESGVCFARSANVGVDDFEAKLDREGESVVEFASAGRCGAPPSLESPKSPPDRAVNPVLGRLSPVDDGDNGEVAEVGDCKAWDGLAKLASDLRGAVF